MALVPIRVPQIGEGLHEARIVAFLKQAGETISRDEPIYQMETDKAVMDVESPSDGVLVKWLAEIDQVVGIGAEIAVLETEATTATSHSEIAAKPESTPERVGIPPRTRAYAKEKGVSEGELQRLAASSEKLMPADIDAYLGTKKSGRQFEDVPLSSKQRILNARLVRATALVVPGTMSLAVDWEGIARERSRIKKSSDELKPSSFTMFAFCVALAVKEHPKLRTSLLGEDTFRTYSQLSLGIAVALPEDELALAVIEDASNLSWPEFAQAFKDRVELAREGKDQAHEAVTLSLTNMQSFGLRSAVPVVVPPAVGTLFLGETYLTAHDENGQVVTRLTANLALTFDHRMMNGAGAAQFMATVRKNVEHIERLLAL
jgi:pyruvate/2-oxoglutarate dehydrogenase complex dihydrolipoamide acyltransferase (E2) component